MSIVKTYIFTSFQPFFYICRSHWGNPVIMNDIKSVINSKYTQKNKLYELRLYLKSPWIHCGFKGYI